MVEALEVVAASIEALPNADIESMAVSAETMPGGNYETLDIYTSGAEAMYCNWCMYHKHLQWEMWERDRLKEEAVRKAFVKDSPGNLTTNYSGLVERIDLSHGASHVNYDLLGVKKKDQLGLFGNDKDHYSCFHRKDLFKK